MSSPRGPWKCSRGCNRQFRSAKATMDHIRDYHKGVGEAVLAPKRRVEEADDETMASRAVQAEIDEACGIDNPDRHWLLP